MVVFFLGNKTGASFGNSAQPGEKRRAGGTNGSTVVGLGLSFGARLVLQRTSIRHGVLEQIVTAGAAIIYGAIFAGDRLARAERIQS
jgi:hypothetical protein